MKKADLVKAVSYVELDCNSKSELILLLHEFEQDIENRKNSRKRKYVEKYAIVVAWICLLFILLGVSTPVYAWFESFVKSRMEEMPEDEVVEIETEIQESEAGIDSYSRDYTKNEQLRMHELYEEYNNGRFPKEEIFKTNTESEVAGYELYYLIQDSYFQLPENRELTDEELLELIDFEMKRNYSLDKVYESNYLEAIEADNQIEQGEIKNNIKKGGISEEEAVQIATERLKTHYNKSDIKGFDFNSYYDKDINLFDGEAYYMVCWCNLITHEYYYFRVSAETGILLEEIITDVSENIRIVNQYPCGKQGGKDAE